jgi:hypothetical protein
MHARGYAVLLIAFVGFFLFLGFAAALILVGREGRRLYRERHIGFDPVTLALVLAAVLLLLAIIVDFWNHFGRD